MAEGPAEVCGTPWSETRGIALDRVSDGGIPGPGVGPGATAGAVNSNGWGMEVLGQAPCPYLEVTCRLSLCTAALTPLLIQPEIDQWNLFPRCFGILRQKY